MPKDKRRTECDSKDSAKFRSLSGEKWRCSEQRFSEAHVGGSVEISLCNQYKFRNYLQKLKG